MVICVPVTRDGRVDPSWGRASRVAIAEVEGGTLARWEEFEVGWDLAHETATEGSHHARVARFLREHGVTLVAAGHMGPPMAHMLEQMGIEVRLGASGDARQVALAEAALPAQRSFPGRASFPGRQVH